MSVSREKLPLEVLQPLALYTFCYNAIGDICYFLHIISVLRF